MKREEIHRSLMRTLRCHHRIYRTEFAKFNISKGQPKVLENDGCIQREIAENCHIEPATATNILATMERNGFIERKANPNDKRVLNVYLTDKGKITQQKVEHVLKNLEENCFVGFNEDEMEQAKIIFDRIYDNLKRGEKSIDD